MNQNQSRSIFIFGCGYLGSRLAKAFIERGHLVGALTRNSVKANELREIGLCEVVECSLESEDWHLLVKGNYDVVINCVSSAGGGIDGYKRSYLEGQNSIMKWAKNHRIEQFVYTSSTSVYASNDLSLVDENSTDLCNLPNSSGSILLGAEQCLLDHSSLFKKYYIFRLSGIYGPDRHYLWDQIQGNGMLPGQPSHFMNMIYVEDIVALFDTLVLNHNLISSGIYNLTDDEPVEKQKVVEWICKNRNIMKPKFDPSFLTTRHSNRNSKPKNRKISNRKLRAIFDLKYPTFRQGYQNIFNGL